MAVLDLRFCTTAFSSCGKRGPLFITVHGPLTIVASLAVEHRLQTRRLSNCGSRAHLLRGMWDLPRPGLKPVSPASAGRFSTTAPPGKPGYVSLPDFVCLVLLLPFGLGFYLFGFFFLPFLPSCVAGMILVLQPGVGHEPLRWESQVQDIGPPDTSRPHVIPNGKNLPEISISTSRPSFTQRPASYSAGHPMPNN